ncbi:glycosyltransferase [Hufsiella ginkgonis]|uniref:Glycosyltransferase n=1 Tax=Hufsiella ginkgonis TaxID=2695274 RepID=A0A7K1Y2Q3_9SPHI|nr:glycosyltransferase [Hufsiella ginkgonis]MXV17502.1 glycosyltransferase [Hufsiella ginkgonis]
MIQQTKVEGVVVLFHPEGPVVDNIRSYAGELNRLYVVDNSPHPDEAIVASLRDFPNCKYLHNGSNDGIAAALNAAARFALDNRAAWLLTMDQDSRFETGAFIKLLDFTLRQDPVATGLVSPFHHTKISVEPVAEVDEVLTIMTSGNLVSLYAWERTGGYDERYFIDAVDWDYCLRLNTGKFKVLRYNRAHLQHNLGNASPHTSVTGKQVTALNYNKTRRYYITRNKLIIISRYLRRYPKFCYAVFKSLFRDLRHVLFYENMKAGKLQYMLKGLLHYLWGRTGRLKA